MASNKIQSFKIILLGDSGTGKSSYVTRLTGEFKDKYVPTIGTQITTIYQKTSQGYVRFNIWDAAGNKEHLGLFDKFYMYSDAALIFYDVTRQSTLRKLNAWNTDIIKICDPIPTVFCANKVDLIGYHKMRIPSQYMIQSCSTNTSYEISMLKEYRYRLPLLWITRKLLNDSDLEFIGEAINLSPKVTVTEEEYKQQLKEFFRHDTNRKYQ